MGSLFGIPGLLWWGLAISVPILIHLFARQRYQRVEWAAMEFLLRAFRKLRRRIRFEHLLLLLLRILAILLFVAALARPLVDPAAFLGLSDSRRQLLVILDNSFSMGVRSAASSTPFQRAREQALRALRGLRAERGDTLTLVTAGRPPRAVLKGVEDLGRARAEIEQIELSDAATDLVGALQTAHALVEDLGEDVEILLLTDLQRTGLGSAGAEVHGEGAPRPEQLLGSVLSSLRARRARLTVVLPASPAELENMAVTELALADRAAIAGIPTNYRTRVHNFGKQPMRGRIHVFVDGSTRASELREIEAIPPGEAQIAEFRILHDSPGSHVVEARFESDGLEVDNRRALTVTVIDRLRVLVVDGDPRPEPGEEESFFLSSALDPGGEGSRSVFAVEVVPDIRFDLADLRSADLLVLMNVGLISRQRADEIHAFVSEGGGLFVTLGDRTQPATLNSLLGRGGAGVLPGEILDLAGEGRGQGPAYGIENAVVTEPPLLYFADPAVRTWLSLPPVYRFFRTKPAESARVLAWFDRRGAALPAPAPALLARDFGRGRAVLFTSSGDQDWNDLVAYPTYLLLVREIAHDLTRKDARQENLLVGQGYGRRLAGFVREVLLSRDGEQLQVLTPLAVEGGDGYEIRTQELARSGVYRLDLGGQDEHGRRDPSPIHIAVNVDTVESDLSRLSEAEARTLFAGEDVSFVNDVEAEAPRAGGDRDGRAWFWVLLAALLVLLLESLLALLFGRRTARETP
jgi:hypothetical protein